MASEVKRRYVIGVNIRTQQQRLWVTSASVLTGCSIGLDPDSIMAANSNDVPAPDFYDDPANSLGYLTRIAFRAFFRQLERRTLMVGVSSGQWPFLRVLWNEEGMSQRELSRRVGMQEPTTVSALNSLEKSGLVRREPSRADRRKIHIFLTPKGHALRSEMMAIVAEVNDIASRGIDPADMATLRRVLAKLSENLSEDDVYGDSATAA